MLECAPTMHAPHLSSRMPLAWLISNMQEKPLLTSWLSFALYSAVASLAVQFLIFPYIFPGFHHGHGLLMGSDATGYHIIASQLADRIEQSGWSAWTLIPDGQSAAGLAAPFYVLFAHEPWSVIPLNAALHATGGLIVIQLLRLLGVRLGVAIAGGALWVCFPSSLQWVSQIQKDSFYFAGMLGVVLSWILLLRSTRRDSTPEKFLAALAVLGAGIALVGAARLYGLQLVQTLAIGLACIAIPILAYKNWKKKADTFRSVSLIIVLVAVPFGLENVRRDVRIDAELPQTNRILEFDETPATARPGKAAIQTAKPITNAVAREYWHRTEFLPRSVDRTMMRIIVMRYGYVGSSYASAGSMIDLDDRILNATEFLMYFPRALQIGFLAPFPSHWISPGVTPGSSVMRKVAGVEMVLLYPLLLIGLPLAVWRWRRNHEFWIIAAFCGSILIAYTYATPNVGTLYRLRYGFFMMLAAVGFASLAEWIADWRKLRKS